MNQTRAALWPIPVQLISRLVAELAAQGIATDTLFSGLRLRRGFLDQADALLSYEQTVLVIERALRLNPKPGLGIDVGERQTPAGWGIVGYAIHCCATVGEGLQMGARYHRVASCLNRLDLHIDGDLACWVMTPPRPLGAVTTFAVEEDVTVFNSASHILTGRSLPLKEVHFAYPLPRHVERYEQRLPCPLRFDMPVSQIVFDRDLLSTPILQANPLSLATATLLCDEFLAANPTEGDLSMRVRRHLLEQNIRTLREDDVASTFCVSTRTLRNQLRREGQSYQGILDSARKQVALSLLRASPLALDDIAARLGFSDGRSFRRAFKKWQGSTPGDYRRGTNVAHALH